MASVLQFISIVVFTLGAPAFSILALVYLYQWKRGSTLFRIFTILCACAFLGSLASAAFVIHSQAFAVLRALLAGILPPMMADLVLEQEQDVNRRRLGRVLPGSLYLAAIIAALGAQSIWSGLFESSSQIILGASSVVALAILIFTRRERNQAELYQRLWNLALFLTLLLVAVIASVSDNPFFSLVPDYVLLLFFAVRLYYTERLAFFDTFVKGGSYFAVGATLLGLLLLTVPPFASMFSADWTHTSLAILTLIPIWILGPFLYHRVGRWTDRALHRKYSAIEAERLFMQSAQTGMSEEDLQNAAVSSLREIFNCKVEVNLGGLAPANADGELVRPLVSGGSIRLLTRESQIPFLSADKRLLETVAATLELLLQNARLRAQQEDQFKREQELEALASRAELRALRAQINPHFLFNALNAIAGWIRTEPEFADDTVAQLAEVFRYTLQRSQTEWVEVRDEVDFIRSYLAVERARFRDRLEIEIEVDPAANSVHIPAMLIQPIVENAIKYGASQASPKGRVTLTIHRHAHLLSIQVTDNGPGFPPTFTLDKVGAGHGLWNVSERLKGYYSTQGSLRWDNESAYTCVTLELGLEEKS